MAATTLSAFKEIVIIGAGMAGLELANELLKNNMQDVVVLEAGPYLHDDHTNAQLHSHDSFSFWQNPTLDKAFYRPWESDHPPHFSGIAGLRGGVGGRSHYWRGVTLRIEEWALADTSWPQAIRSDLENGLYQEVETHLKKWVGADLNSVRSIQEASLLKFLNNIFHGQCEPVPLARQRWYTEYGERWRAYSPIHEWKSLGGTIDSLESSVIFSNCEVIDIQLKKDNIKSIIFRDKNAGSIGTVDCKTVVLAGAAIENTRLAAQTLAKIGSIDTSFFGLNDHIRLGFAIKIPLANFNSEVIPAGFAIINGDGVTQSNIFIEVETIPATTDMLCNVWCMAEQKRSRHNTVYFDDKSDLPWKSRVTLKSGSADDEVIAIQKVELQKIWHQLSLAFNMTQSDLRFDNFWDGNSRSFGAAYNQAMAENRYDDCAEAITYCCPLGSVDHEGGTLPYGELINEDGMLKEVAGVFVVGASTFPRAGAANPALTILALARRTGRKIVSYLNHKK
jgi:hypothetical protein